MAIAAKSCIKQGLCKQHPQNDYHKQQPASDIQEAWLQSPKSRLKPWSFLVHGWDRIKNLNCYSLLALSTHKKAKCYPTMTKFYWG